jgi:hypothetical protein
METYDETEEEVRKDEPDKEEWKMKKGDRGRGNREGSKEGSR